MNWKTICKYIELQFLPTPLHKCTAPLRLRSPLRAEGIYATYTGDYACLGSESETIGSSGRFSDQCFHFLVASGKKIVLSLEIDTNKPSHLVSF